jgi:hypothetical protein
MRGASAVVPALPGAGPAQGELLVTLLLLVRYRRGKATGPFAYSLAEISRRVHDYL